MTHTRREFFGSLLAVGASVGLVSLVGCGDDGGGTDSGTGSDTGTGTDGGGTCANWGANVGSNHGHEMTVSAADVEAGVDKTYDITGTSTHPHTVIITAAEFATLATGTSVMVTSSSDNGHTHSVAVSCMDD